MGKNILKRSLVMGALMAFGIVGNGFAADLTLTTSYDEITDKYTVKAAPDQSYLQDIGNVGSGDMYYTANSYNDNKFILLDEIRYHRGLLLAVGFYRDDTNDEAVEKHNIKNNTMNIGDNDGDKTVIAPNGGMELTAGYFSKYAYGEAVNNKIFCYNAELKASGFLGLYAVFANQNNNVDRNKLVDVVNNSVTISDSSFSAQKNYLEVFGGYPKYGTAASNMVDITSSNFDALCGIKICGGFVEVEGDAINNILRITGTKSNPSDIKSKEDVIIAGGYSYAKGNANNNTVDLSYSNLENNRIYGGYAIIGNAIGNTVTVSNSNLKDSSLYGGYSASDGIVSGNTLNVGENISGKLDVINGFDTINFENIKWENGGTVLETDKLILAGNEIAKNSSVEEKGTDVIIKKISGNVKVNDYMNLITSDEEIVGKLANAGEQSVEVGVAQIVKIATGNLEKESNAIKFTIIDAGLNPQVGALADANVVANAFVANGTGLVEDSINAMICEERIGYKTFAQVHGSNLDFDTNNNLSVQGWSGIVGVGETTKDRLTYGVFFETGDGDYNTFAKQSEGYVRGDGEVDYNGGGLLVRKDYENGIYTEASLRAGRMNNEVRDAVVDSSNKLNGFDISSTYYGAHIGVGKIIPRGEQESLDIYGKFLYSHHDGESFVIDGDTFNMDSVNSQRLRVGFRYNELNSHKLRMYYGAAYEYEFDGDANNTVLDYNFSSPDLGGSTVVGELGLHYNADAKWCFDLNVRGYAGQREGFTGSIQANYLF